MSCWMSKCYFWNK